MPHYNSPTAVATILAREYDDAFDKLRFVMVSPLLGTLGRAWLIGHAARPTLGYPKLVDRVLDRVDLFEDPDVQVLVGDQVLRAGRKAGRG